MFQPNLITSVVIWEKIQQLEDEKRQMNRFEDDFTVANIKLEKAAKTAPRMAIAEFVNRNQSRIVDYAGCGSEPCQDVQAG
jgi:hypothetical protein